MGCCLTKLEPTEIHWAGITRFEVQTFFLMSLEDQSSDQSLIESYTLGDTHIYLPNIYTHTYIVLIYLTSCSDCVENSPNLQPMESPWHLKISLKFQLIESQCLWIPHKQRSAEFCRDQNRRKLSLLLLNWWTSESIAWINRPLLNIEKLNRQP